MLFLRDLTSTCLERHPCQSVLHFYIVVLPKHWAFSAFIVLFLFCAIPAIAYSACKLFSLCPASFKIHRRRQPPQQLLSTCITALTDNTEIIYISVSFLRENMLFQRKDHILIHFYVHIIQHDIWDTVISQ